MKPEITSSAVSRRNFLKATAVTASTPAFPSILRPQAGGSPNGKINLLCIGVGGRGRRDIRDMAAEHFVAFCDVDDERAAMTKKQQGESAGSGIQKSP